jgi:hypothetical protein
MQFGSYFFHSDILRQWKRSVLIFQRLDHFESDYPSTRKVDITANIDQSSSMNNYISSINLRRNNVYYGKNAVSDIMMA